MNSTESMIVDTAGSLHQPKQSLLHRLLSWFGGDTAAIGSLAVATTCMMYVPATKIQPTKVYGAKASAPVELLVGGGRTDLEEGALNSTLFQQPHLGAEAAYLVELKSRYQRMSATDWFREAHEDRSLGDVLPIL